MITQSVEPLHRTVSIMAEITALTIGLFWV